MDERMKKVQHAVERELSPSTDWPSCRRSSTASRLSWMGGLER
jgi:hypothetical protein